jgi:hypothetical protein
MPSHHHHHHQCWPTYKVNVKVVICMELQYLAVSILQGFTSVCILFLRIVDVSSVWCFARAYVLNIDIVCMGTKNM